MPLFCFGRVEADTVIGSKPKITFVIFDDGIYLIVDERLLVANRMFDPFITGILIVAYCDADTCLIINIFRLDTVVQIQYFTSYVPY